MREHETAAEGKRARYYKQVMRKIQRLRLVNVTVLLVFFAVIAILLVALKRPTVSEMENRKLAEFPQFTWTALFSGEYTNAVAEHYNDTIPNRDAFKRIVSYLTELQGTRLNDTKIYSGVGPQQAEVQAPQSGKEESSSAVEAPLPPESHEPASEGTESDGESSVSAEEPENPEAQGVFDENGSILIVNNRAMEMFGGLYDVAEAYAKTLDSYQRDLAGQTQVYEMTIPLALSFYLPENYRDMTSQPKDFIDFIAGKLTEAQHVNLYDRLMAHKDEAIYLRTDHHWSALGAYYAAETFAEAAQVPFLDLSEYEEEVTPGYVGTMYAFTQDATLLNNPDDFLRYKPEKNYTVQYYDPDYEEVDYGDDIFFETDLSNKYLSVMGSDQLIAEITTDVKNGRKLAIFKDSYGNMLPPFLTHSFAEIYVIDMRYFNLNAIAYLQEKGATDLLFANCVFTACGYNTAEELRVQ